jgi:uncharacterized repeat protein (TIGR01451 family)
MKIMRHYSAKSAFVIVSTVFLLVGVASPTFGKGPPNFSNCRLGIGGLKGTFVGDYNISQLNTGLYLDWDTSADPTSDPGVAPGVTYVQIVRVHQKKADYGSGWFGPPREYFDPPTYLTSPALGQISNIAASQPGSLWLVGNEMERVDLPEGNGWGGQDEITPELYATAFHDIQAAIKTADPSARVAIGGMIEPTQLRLEYLDRVWDSYFNKYGHSMGDDIDVWNIHLFILREVRDSWGAEIPAGLADVNGFLSELDDTPPNGLQALFDAHHDMNHFRRFVEDFRTWLAAHGQRNKPLLVSEYGTLLPLEDQSLVNSFLTATFDYLFAAADTGIGLPADQNRLVQGWVWYSLNDDTFFAESSLFDPSTKTLTSLGNTWKNYVTSATNPLASQPRHNLLVANLRTEPEIPSILSGSSVAVTLRADIANSGNTGTSTGNNIAVKFWAGAPGSNQIGSTQMIEDLPGCGNFTTVEVNWPGRGAGQHPWSVEVIAISGETTTADNTAGSVVTVLDGLPDADLTVAKSPSNFSPFAGIDPVDYTILVSNLGPDPVTGVVVNELLPAGVTFESYSSSQGNYFTAGVWQVGTLDSLADATLTVTVSVDEGQGGNTIVNNVSVDSAPRNDPEPGNDAASVSIDALQAKKVFLPMILK